MNKTHYVYPAVFHYDERPGIGVTFPDLPGCVSQGNSEEEALQMAQEALLGHLSVSLDHGDTLPSPSKLAAIDLEHYEFKEAGERLVLAIIAVPKKAVHELGKRSIKKTLTIPKWMNDAAEAEGINFSQVLQQALQQKLNESLS